METRTAQRNRVRRERTERERARLDITDDLTEEQLAERAFAEEIVVYQGRTSRNFGIIVGYEDPTQDAPGYFVVDRVEPGPDADDAEAWRETGETLRLHRNQFVVFGPANRDPGDREVEPSPDGWEVLRPHAEASDGPSPLQKLHEALSLRAQPDPQLTAFVGCMLALLDVAMDGGGWALSVRLDVNADDRDLEHRTYRLLVRPAVPPLQHDEIEQCLDIASAYELAAIHSNVGIEIHRP